MDRSIARWGVSTLVLTLAASVVSAQQTPSGRQRTMPPRPTSNVDPFAPGPNTVPPPSFAPGSIRRDAPPTTATPNSGKLPQRTASTVTVPRDYPVRQTQYVDPRYSSPQPSGANTPAAATSDEPNPFNAQLGAEPLLVTPTTPAPRDDIPDASTGPTGNGKPGAKQLEGPQSAALVVEKIAPGELQVGKAVTVEIQVRNVGTATAHDVVLRDEIPRGAQLVGSRPRAERENGGELVWKIGAVQPGEKISVYCELMPTTEGELGSVATVHYAAAASSRSVVTRPELALEVAAPSEVLIGDPVSFRIKVSNPGTGVATGVVLSSRVPANLDHPAGEEIEYEIGNLRPGESKMLELSMRASQAGTAMNIIVVRGDGALQADRQTPVTVIAPCSKWRWKVRASGSSIARPRTRSASRTPAPRRPRKSSSWLICRRVSSSSRPTTRVTSINKPAPCTGYSKSCPPRKREACR